MGQALDDSPNRRSPTTRLLVVSGSVAREAEVRATVVALGAQNRGEQEIGRRDGACNVDPGPAVRNQCDVRRVGLGRGPHRHDEQSLGHDLWAIHWMVPDQVDVRPRFDTPVLQPIDGHPDQSRPPRNEDLQAQGLLGARQHRTPDGLTRENAWIPWDSTDHLLGGEGAMPPLDDAHHNVVFRDRNSGVQVAARHRDRGAAGLRLLQGNGSVLFDEGDIDRIALGHHHRASTE